MKGSHPKVTVDSLAGGLQSSGLARPPRPVSPRSTASLRHDRTLSGSSDDIKVHTPSSSASAHTRRDRDDPRVPLDSQSTRTPLLTPPRTLDFQTGARDRPRPIDLADTELGNGTVTYKTDDGVTHVVISPRFRTPIEQIFLLVGVVQKELKDQMARAWTGDALPVFRVSSAENDSPFALDSPSLSPPRPGAGPTSTPSNADTLSVHTRSDASVRGASGAASQGVEDTPVGSERENQSVTSSSPADVNMLARHVALLNEVERLLVLATVSPSAAAHRFDMSHLDLEFQNYLMHNTNPVNYAIQHPGDAQFDEEVGDSETEDMIDQASVGMPLPVMSANRRFRAHTAGGRPRSYSAHQPLSPSRRTAATLMSRQKPRRTSLPDISDMARRTGSATPSDHNSTGPHSLRQSQRSSPQTLAPLLTSPLVPAFGRLPPLARAGTAPTVPLGGFSPSSQEEPTPLDTTTTSEAPLTDVTESAGRSASPSPSTVFSTLGGAALPPQQAPSNNLTFSIERTSPVASKNRSSFTFPRASIHNSNATQGASGPPRPVPLLPSVESPSHALPIAIERTPTTLSLTEEEGDVTAPPNSQSSVEEVLANEKLAAPPLTPTPASPPTLSRVPSSAPLSPAEVAAIAAAAARRTVVLENSIVSQSAQTLPSELSSPLSRKFRSFSQTVACTPPITPSSGVPTAAGGTPILNCTPVNSGPPAGSSSASSTAAPSTPGSSASSLMPPLAALSSPTSLSPRKHRFSLPAETTNSVAAMNSRPLDGSELRSALLGARSPTNVGASVAFTVDAKHQVWMRRSAPLPLPPSSSAPVPVATIPSPRSPKSPVALPPNALQRAPSTASRPSSSRHHRSMTRVFAQSQTSQLAVALERASRLGSDRQPIRRTFAKLVPKLDLRALLSPPQQRLCFELTDNPMFPLAPPEQSTSQTLSRSITTSSIGGVPQSPGFLSFADSGLPTTAVNTPINHISSAVSSSSSSPVPVFNKDKDKDEQSSQLTAYRAYLKETFPDEWRAGPSVEQSPTGQRAWARIHRFFPHSLLPFGDAACIALASELDLLETWNKFDVFRVHELTQGHALTTLFSCIFERQGFTDNKFGISRRCVLGFAADVERHYVSSITYHNSIHGADVLQAVYALVCSNPRLATGLTDLERVCLFVAAVAHDLGHPGLTNAFLINSHSALARVYNDKNVLESYHLSAVFAILDKDSCRLFEGMTNPEYREARALIVELILATDLSSHFQLLSHFKGNLAHPEFDGGLLPLPPPVLPFAAQLSPAAATESSPGSAAAAGPSSAPASPPLPPLVAPPVSPEGKQSREQLMKIIIKCGDISHPVRSRLQHLLWSERAVCEFFLQGDLEKALGLPVSMFMDRDTTPLPKSQIGFVRLLVQPLFDAMSHFLTRVRPPASTLATAPSTLAGWSPKSSTSDGHGGDVPHPALLRATSGSGTHTSFSCETRPRSKSLYSTHKDSSLEDSPLSHGLSALALSSSRMGSFSFPPPPPSRPGSVMSSHSANSVPLEVLIPQLIQANVAMWEQAQAACEAQEAMAAPAGGDSCASGTGSLVMPAQASSAPAPQSHLDSSKSHNSARGSISSTDKILLAGSEESQASRYGGNRQRMFLSLLGDYYSEQPSAAGVVFSTRPPSRTSSHSTPHHS